MTEGRELRLLVVGDLGPGSSDLVSETPGVTFAALEEVSAETLALIQPDVVLAPLVSAGFDCFDLAAVLVEAGYKGRFRAAAARIPDPGLVRRDVAAHFPGLDFDLFLLAEAGDGMPN